MKRSFLYFICLAFICFVNPAYSQRYLINKLVDEAIDRRDNAVDNAIDKGFDSVEDSIEKSGKDSQKKETQTTGQQGDDQKSQNSSGDKSSTANQPKLESYTKYDFIPGDKVLLYEDFSQDAVGDFPALWTTNGSGEVRTLNNYPGNWFYMNSDGSVYCLMQDIQLPDNFILEFDVVAAPQSEGYDHSSFQLTLFQGEGEYLQDALYPGTGGVHITCGDDRWEIQSYSYDAEQMPTGRTELSTIEVNKLNHVIIWAQKRRLRIYHKGQKVLDLPTILYTQVKYNRLRVSLWGQGGFPFITNIRFTSASPDIRSKLLTEGKLVSYGIYFDVNSDKVKPESYGSINEIAKVLKENPDVKIKIVGHTDGDGDAAKNLDLSKRRAASVKNELATTFGIDGGRIQTDGAGESQPVSGNDTPENKAKNRRVEFIKL
jgi:OmpA-OmpF porin, OOP family